MRHVQTLAAERRLRSPRPRARGDRGVWAEDLAARHLVRSGWRILARNYRFERNEIDLIAERANVIAFVEVKSGTTGRFGDPLAAIGGKKRAAIERAAAGWVEEHPTPGACYRFDAVCVESAGDGQREPLLRHVEEAWGF